ncbi:tyrosine-type recombinase/integrase [Deltaproteobacteria bacterium TL4]
MSPLITQFMDHLSSKKYSENSLQNHRLDLFKFEKWLSGEEEMTLIRLQKLKAPDIKAYSEELLQRMKPRSVARHLSTLKLFLDFWESQGLLISNPVYLVRFPEIVPEPPEMISSHEIVALLEAPSKEHYLGIRDRAMLELAYSCGLKVHELTALNVGDLFLDLKFLKVRGKRERMVPMTSKAVEILMEYLAQTRQERLENKEDPCLFVNRNGKRITRIGFWNIIKKHARRVGITSKINPRILRHSFAIHLIQNGMDLTGIQALFGYVDLDATLQYAHINRPDFHEVYHRCHPRGNAKLPTQ